MRQAFGSASNGLRRTLPVGRGGQLQPRTLGLAAQLPGTNSALWEHLLSERSSVRRGSIQRWLLDGSTLSHKAIVAAGYPIEKRCCMFTWQDSGLGFGLVAGSVGTDICGIVLECCRT